jgi:hypothetical protein
MDIFDCLAAGQRMSALRIPRFVEGFWRAWRSESAWLTFRKGSFSGATAPNGSPGTFATRLKGFDVFRANFGAEAAPCMLRMVAYTLELAVWRTDHVGRWSDDQFLVILKGSSGDSLRAVGNTAESMLARARPNLRGRTCKPSRIKKPIPQNPLRARRPGARQKVRHYLRGGGFRRSKLK